MSYQILAQKYRPQKFEDVVGQEAVTRTLRNSILNGRIANAYIFCGPRGVGKTSIARLVAKTLNCKEPASKSPCNECVLCREITQGNNIDVLEIDGASNNGVDEIRTLRENVKFSPSKGKYKIYIIDEVHMLSQGAFNALLKTLEEPPAHVKFIFATTEPHKVLPTIISRCQKFDFKRIPPRMISDRILYIGKKERIDIDEKTALLIAHAADGSLRDSLVILDQMISFSGRKVDSEDVTELLGMVHKSIIADLANAVIESNSRRIAEILDKLIANGKDPVFIANSLIKHYRDIMILKTTEGSPTSDMAFSAEELGNLKFQMQRLSLEEILYILQNLSHCLTLMKGTVFARAPLEIVLIKLTRRGNILSLAKVLEELEKITGKGYNNGENFFDSIESSSLTCPEGDISTAGTPVKNSPNTDFSVKSNDSGEGNGESKFKEGSFIPEEFNWKAILNYVKSKKMSVFTFLNQASPVEFNDKKVIIGFGKDFEFNKEVLEAESNKNIIEEAVNKVTGSSPRIEFVILEFLGKSEDKNINTAEKKVEMKEKMKPVIEKAMDVFGGQVVRDLMEEKR